MKNKEKDIPVYQMAHLLIFSRKNHSCVNISWRSNFPAADLIACHTFRVRDAFDLLTCF